MRMVDFALARFSRSAVLLATLAVAAIAVMVGNDVHAADMFKGKKIYATNCALCHGPTGISTFPGAPNFARQEGILKPDFTLLSTIRSGRNAMPAFQGILTDRDIMDVIAYIRTLN